MRANEKRGKAGPAKESASREKGFIDVPMPRSVAATLLTRDWRDYRPLLMQVSEKEQGPAPGSRDTKGAEFLWSQRHFL